VVYAVIDVANNTLTFARAGHELPLIVRRDWTSGVAVPQFVASEGMAVGLVSDEMFADVLEDKTERFGPGDVFVLYTDGLTEAPNEDGKEFSGARLVDALRGAFDQGPRGINDVILQAVGRFAGDTPQRDDFTLVTVQRI
jgi:sigma-B regulation protein RsbU (phosphoserine phosphatase)